MPTKGEYEDDGKSQAGEPETQGEPGARSEDQRDRVHRNHLWIERESKCRAWCVCARNS
jgi:hypothetical protein